MSNTKEDVYTSDRQHAGTFKALLLIPCVAASLGELAHAARRQYPNQPAVSIPCRIALSVSLEAQIFFLPVITLWMSTKLTLQTKCARWVLYGVALVGLQAVLLGIQLYQTIFWESVKTNIPMNRGWWE